jgi:hypothetical protein
MESIQQIPVFVVITLIKVAVVLAIYMTTRRGSVRMDCCSRSRM